jgi:hypothetical protein
MHPANTAQTTVCSSLIANSRRSSVTVAVAPPVALSIPRAGASHSVRVALGSAQ